MNATNDRNKIRVVLLFGGQSSEHEVSLLSARNVLAALDRSRFVPQLVAIDKQGIWRTATEDQLTTAVGNPKLLKLSTSGPPLLIPPGPSAGIPSILEDPSYAATVVFPVLHGSHGEDGTVQGLLELANVAYVGSSHLGSAIAMDKDVTKRLLVHAGIPVVPWQVVRARDFAEAPQPILGAAASLGYPLFVKPANAGSSVGVHKVKHPSLLSAAITDALLHDDKILIESGIDAREIECAVLGNDRPTVAVPGEIVVTHPDGFYSYDAKYVDSSGSRVELPAKIPTEIAEQLRQMAAKAFIALELSGLARIDFFLDRETRKVYLNEVNTIPGFTAISMYPKMWEAAGVSQVELISRLIDLAQERHRRRRNLS